MSSERKNRGDGIFIVVTGPSGAGKTTLCRELLKKVPGLSFSVSYTTRPPRSAEVHGKDYYFVSERNFRDRIEKGEFAEWAENYGFLYGTSKKTMSEVLSRGVDLILDVDTRGARALKTSYAGGIFVFVLPPSVEVLKERLKKRGADHEAVLEKRLNNAVEEMREIVWYDYAVFNDRLSSAVDHLRGIYLAERSRTERLTKEIEHFIK